MVDRAESTDELTTYSRSNKHNFTSRVTSEFFYTYHDLSHPHRVGTTSVKTDVKPDHRPTDPHRIITAETTRTGFTGSADRDSGHTRCRPVAQKTDIQNNIPRIAADFWLGEVEVATGRTCPKCGSAIV